MRKTKPRRHKDGEKQVRRLARKSAKVAYLRFEQFYNAELARWRERGIEGSHMSLETAWEKFKNEAMGKRPTLG